MMQWKDVLIAQLPEIAREIAKQLKAGDVILVNASMGSGKTTFAASLVEALGGKKQEVSSPTFSIVQSYPLGNGMVFNHLDLYRLKNH
ncbi:MAG: tRNA (adenosine(37)-N6)-threonylcarbamoyltransferase complex ATPase subunit type 1 TsaE, partial [Luteibaculum sp.]